MPIIETTNNFNAHLAYLLHWGWGNKDMRTKPPEESEKTHFLFKLFNGHVPSLSSLATCWLIAGIELEKLI